MRSAQGSECWAVKRHRQRVLAMARKAEGAWFRTSKNGWYATVEGKAIALGIKGSENRAEAMRAWHLLMAGMPLPDTTAEEPDAKPVPKGTGDDLTAMVEAFLADKQEKVTGHTLEVYRLYLTQFAQTFRTMPITARAVERWANRPSWCSTTQNDVMGMVTTLNSPSSLLVVRMGSDAFVAA